MEILRELDDLEFDFARAKKAVSVYSHSVGIKCSIIDPRGNTLYSINGYNDLCDFCITLNKTDCANAKLYGSYQAERFGGSYIFFCPLGLVHWASPIIIQGIVKGSVLGGPVLMVEPEEFLIDEIIRKNNIEEAFVAELIKFIHQVPVVKPDQVHNYAELLFIVTSHLSDVPPSEYLEDQAYLNQQKDISEFIYDLKIKDADTRSVANYPIEKEKKLLTLIAQGDKAGSQKTLNEIFGYIFFATGGNFEVTKARVLELIVLLSRAALEGGADIEQIFGLNFQYLSQLEQFHTFEELTFWLSKIMARFTDCVFNLTQVKHIDVIYKAIDYLKRNYMKKITLEEVANYINLSPSYFCKIFKDEMKLSFNQYLNKVRINMSKKLLADDSIALVDVTNLVGYEDQSYFSRVFKKQTGVSPGRYRESRGQINDAITNKTS
jgi:two-component system, response regulator YesN